MPIPSSQIFALPVQAYDPYKQQRAGRQIPQQDNQFCLAHTVVQTMKATGVHCRHMKQVSLGEQRQQRSGSSDTLCVCAYI